MAYGGFASVRVFRAQKRTHMCVEMFGRFLNHIFGVVRRAKRGASYRVKVPL